MLLVRKAEGHGQVPAGRGRGAIPWPASVWPGSHWPGRTDEVIAEGVGAPTLWAREESADISRSCGGYRKLGRWGHRHRAGLGSWTDMAHAGDIPLHPEIGEDPPVPAHRAVKSVAGRAPQEKGL